MAQLTLDQQKAIATASARMRLQQGGEGPPPRAPAETIGVGGAAKGSFASTPEEAIDYFAGTMYPDEPLETSRQRFSVDRDRIYYTYEQGQKQPAVQGILPRLAGGVGPSLPYLAGGVAGIATAPMLMGGPLGMVGSMAATGGAAALGETARQKIGDWMGLGDPSINPISVITEGGTALFGQGFGRGVGALRQRYTVPDIGKYNPQQTAQNYAAAERQGVRITPAEATNLSSLKAAQKRLGNITPTSDAMQDFYERRNVDVTNAYNRFLDGVSRTGSADDIANSARQAARDVIEETVAARSRAAGPYYQRAFDANAKVDIRPIVDGLDGRIASAKGGIKDALLRAKTLLMRTDVPSAANEPETRLRALHEAKMALDDMIESAGQTGMGKAAKRELINVKNALLGAMDDVSPDYKQARQIFSTESETVDRVVNSTVKILADLKDTKAQNAAMTILSPSQNSPGSVAQARALIEQQNPKAWQGIKRLFLQQKMDEAFRISETGDVVNPAGKLYATLMKGPIRANLQAAMTGQEWQQFTDMMHVFRMASRVKPIGSDTAWNQMENAAVTESARPMIAKIIRNLNPAQLLRSAQEWLTNRSVEKQAQDMVRLVTSGDPNAAATLKQLRQVQPGSARFMVLLGHLVSQGGAAAADEALQ